MGAHPPARGRRRDDRRERDPDHARPHLHKGAGSRSCSARCEALASRRALGLDFAQSTRRLPSRCSRSEHLFAYAMEGGGPREQRLARACRSSNREEIRSLDMAPARSREGGAGPLARPGRVRRDTVSKHNGQTSAPAGAGRYVVVALPRFSSGLRKTGCSAWRSLWSRRGTSAMAVFQQPDPRLE